uniref:CHK domain-containing protein n=1 Tax=Caenorhabditis japonica TaxID=281687 RepID=A0A8R1EQ40_CAEJA
MESNVVALNRETRRWKKNVFHDILKILQLRILSLRSGNIREHEFFSKKFDRELLPIGRHGLTAGWLIESLGQLLNSDAIKNIKCSQLGSDGFVSQIMRVTIEFSNHQQKRFIVKMPETTNIKAALEKTTQKKMPEGADEQFIGGLTMFFNREVEFYKMDKIPGLRLPKCYHSQSWKLGKTTGAIVMQDLRGMVSVPYYESLNLQQVASVGSQMINLHLFSIGMPDEWKEKFPFPMELIDTVSNMTDIVKLYVSRNPVLAEGFSRVEKMYTDRELFVRVLRDSHKSLGIDDFLCHGDLWFYNLMWLPTVSGSETASNHLGAIIDWQNVHTGSITQDFCHMFTFCCDTEIRRQAENVFLPYYYNQLKTKANNAGKKLNLTLNQFLRAYRRNFIAHALHFPFIASIMLCVKPADDENVQKARNEHLIERVLGAWEDAVQAMHEEYPEYSL